MDELLGKVKEIRESSASFYVVDLHLHSPSSYDWDNSGNEEQPRDPILDRIPADKSIPEDVVDAYRMSVARSGRDLIAITDHNVSSFSEATAYKNRTPGPHVLPGIELSVAFSNAPLIRDLRIHVLAIFPEETHHEAIARILPHGTLAEATRDRKASLIYPTVDDLIERIHQEGGLAIAAHIESTNGLRGVYKNTIQLMLEPIGGSSEAQEVFKALGDQVKDELVKFDAIQVKPETEAVHYKGAKGGLRVPLVVASDLHKAQDLSEEHSEKYSFVKMARPSFKGLSDAIKFPDVRIRFKTNLPEAQPPRLLGLRIVGRKSTENTFFDDITLGFSDNLTCIIGPRGSGKSAAIDALRYLMGYNRTLNQISKVSEQVTDRQRHTLEKTRIEALYQAADGRVYKLVATYDKHEDYMTEVYDLYGNKLNIEDVGECGEFPLNLFGWGELELLAQNPETQRELLDRFIPVVCALKEEKAELYSSLTKNRQSCVDQAHRMDAYFTNPHLDFRRLNEFRAQFEDLNTPEIETLFAQIDSVRSKRKIIKDITKELQQRLDKGDIASALEIGKLLENTDLEKWADELAGRLKPKELDDWMQKTSREHEYLVKIVLSIIAAEDENLASQEEDAEKEIQKVIGEDQAITGDLRNRAKSRYEKANGNYMDYKKLHDALDKMLRDREALINCIESKDKLIFETRNKETSCIREKVSLVEDDHYKIDLVLQQQADRSAFLTALEKGVLTFYGQWKAGKRPEIISSTLTPRTLVDKIVSGDIKTLAELTIKISGTEYSMRTTDAERLVGDNTPYMEIEGLDTAKVDPSKLDKLLRIHEVPIDDAFFINLGGKPIQYCSPGQRCSAMLPVVTLTSQAPLVIDQPEDNLDNRLVSRALFKILARLKETRQIILATHNPNILVSGDAEQVLLLHAKGNLEQHGCIDNPSIIDSVLELMEGGAEAFERRHMKYEPYL